jgi:hypothetical protein
MTLGAVIENLHGARAGVVLIRSDKGSNLQLSVPRQTQADNAVIRTPAPNGSNLLLPGWRDIKLPPPKPTA